MKKQMGATLIVVLAMLVLITLIGALAIKSGILGLKISTNSQVRALLMENNNAALFNIEDPTQVSRQLALDGMFAYFNSAANADDELVFCYKASANQFFKLSEASVISPNGVMTKIGISGFCGAKDFSSGRSAVITQVYLNKKSDKVGAFSSVPEGTSLGQANVPVIANSIGAKVISILPSFSGASVKDLESCFKKRGSEVGKCFADLDVPYNVQHADYVVGGKPILMN